MKNILIIVNIMVIITIAVLLFFILSYKENIITLSSFLLISFVINILLLVTGKKVISGSGSIDELNLKTRVTDFLNVLDKGNINESLLKETYRKTIRLFESLVIDKETNTIIIEHFKFLVENEIKRSGRYQSKFSLLVIKVNNYAQFKDKTSGILRELKNLSKFLLRDMDVVGRYSNESIIFLLPETGIKGAHTVGGRVLKLLPTINKQKIVDQEVQLSIGISTFPYNGKYYDVLIQNAEKNLTQAEMLGGNQVIFNVEEV
ncbi:MAG: GGDEF domain-containing protein [Spirochaetes bacterium]|nr:GGDEF domain-containing protein [Spirochaetota bacterium]